MKKVIQKLILLTGILFSCGTGSPSAPTELPTSSLPLGALEQANIILESNNLTSLESISANCHVSAPNAQTDGQCLTPINITGKASSISLGRTTGGPPARLFGSTVGAISLDRHGELEVSPFDFANALGFEGESNLQDDELKTEWNQLTVYVAYMDVKAQIKQKFWTVRFAFVSEPVSEEEFITSCVDEFYLESIAGNSGLLDDNADNKTFQLGDMLLCIKDNEDGLCSPSDFQWLDTNSDSFVSTRPTSPHQHEFTPYIETECSQEGGEGYDIQLGGYDLYADIEEPFELSAKLEECQQIFTYTNPITEEISTGNTMSATFDYDSTQTVLLKDINTSQLDTFSNAEIFEAFTLKQLYLRANSDDPEGTGNDPNIDVTATITVSDDETTTCVDSTDVDSSLLTGDDCQPDGEIRDDCTHETCSPGFESMSGSIWSSSSYSSGSETCTEYCTRQTCDEYNGSWRNIYCIPECGE